MCDNKVIRLTNCRVLIPHKGLVVNDLWIRNRCIIDPAKLFFSERIEADLTVPLANLIVAPSYIDTQINGAFGIDFSNISDISSVKTVSKGLLAYGVTSYCPTIITSASEYYHSILPGIKPTPGSSEDGASILGLHLEGPFISPDKSGMHPRQDIQKNECTLSDIKSIYGKGFSNAQIITICPKSLDSLDTIESLKSKYPDLVISIGHTSTDFNSSLSAVERGASCVTHLFNAMSAFHHRDPGVIGLLTTGKQVFFGLISDGYHTDPTVVRIAHLCNAPKIVLVSDAVSLLGTKELSSEKESKFMFGCVGAVIRNGQAYVDGSNTICGSVTAIDECVRRYRKYTECSISEAVEAASLHPAQMLGIDDRKGKLLPGYDADFIILDDDLNVLATFIAGKCLYKHSTFSIPL